MSGQVFAPTPPPTPPSTPTLTPTPTLTLTPEPTPRNVNKSAARARQRARYKAKQFSSAEPTGGSTVNPRLIAIQRYRGDISYWAARLDQSAALTRNLRFKYTDDEQRMSDAGISPTIMLSIIAEHNVLIDGHWKEMWRIREHLDLVRIHLAQLETGTDV